MVSFFRWLCIFSDMLPKVEKWCLFETSPDFPSAGSNSCSSGKGENEETRISQETVQFSCSVCPTLFNPMDCSMPAFSVHYQFPELAQSYVHWVHDAIQPSHPRPLLLLPLIFPSIRVFSNESVLCIRWPKYWSFRISISSSNEYSGLIFFRIDWLNLLAVQGTLKSLLQHDTSKA